VKAKKSKKGRGKSKKNTVSARVRIREAVGKDGREWGREGEQGG